MTNMEDNLDDSFVSPTKPAKDTPLDENFNAIPLVDVASLSTSQQDLLLYYKQRVEFFETERETYLDKIRHFKGSSNDVHKLNWELQKRDDQIADLQRALSDAHVYLYEERDQVLKLSSEIDELKIQEIEDKKRIQHLKSLTQPISQDVTYFRDCRPHTITRKYAAGKHGEKGDLDPKIYLRPQKKGQQPNHAGGSVRRDKAFGGSGMGSPGREDRVADEKGEKAQARRGSPQRVVIESAIVKNKGRKGRKTSTKKNRGAAKKVSGNAESRVNSGRGGGKGSNVVRTIYMPNESVDVLKLIIRSLRTQLDEQVALAEQRCQALLEDRLIREAETKERDEKQRERIEDLNKEIQELRREGQETTKDYLELRHRSQAQEKKLREQQVVLQNAHSNLEKQLATVMRNAQRKQKNAKSESQEYLDYYRTQTISTEEDLAVIKSQYNAMQELYEKRISYLEGRILTLKEKYGILDKRRKLETEGFVNDFKNARSKIRNIEKVLVHIRGALGAQIYSTNNSATTTNGSSGGGSTNTNDYPDGALNHSVQLATDDINALKDELAVVAQRIQTAMR